MVTTKDKETFNLLNEEYQKAKSLYENKKFEDSIKSFEKLNKKQFHKINKFYIEHAQDYLDNPSKQFNLVFNITSK